jgi:hypothetical protein
VLRGAERGVPLHRRARRRRGRAQLAVAVALLCAFALVARADPATDYALHCRGCHLADGAGVPGRVPALDGLGALLRAPGGREYLVRVPGVAQASLSDAALADLLGWTLRRFDPTGVPPDFAPYTADEVARLRARPLTDVAGARKALTQRLPR